MEMEMETFRLPSYAVRCIPEESVCSQYCSAVQLCSSDINFDTLAVRAAGC